MRILHPVIETLVRAIFDIGHDLPFSGPIRAQLVGHHPLWLDTLFLEKSDQEAFGGVCVALCLDNLVEDISNLINGGPELAFLATGGNNDLIQIPSIAM